MMKSCRQCEHDVCQACVRKLTQPEIQHVDGSGYHQSMLDEVNATTENITSKRRAQNVPFELSSIFFDKCAPVSETNDDIGETARHKQRAGSDRMIERVVASLIVVYVAIVYVWRDTVTTPDVGLSTN